MSMLNKTQSVNIVYKDDANVIFEKDEIWALNNTVVSKDVIESGLKIECQEKLHKFEHFLNSLDCNFHYEFSGTETEFEPMKAEMLVISYHCRVRDSIVYCELSNWALNFLSFKELLQNVDAFFLGKTIKS